MLIFLSIFLGAIIALHLAMNARVGEILGSPGTGNMFFWIIGALTAVLIWLVQGQWMAAQRWKDVPPGLWPSGVMGASLVLGISYVMPRLGVGVTTIGLVGGQIITAAIMGHFGWLSSQAVALDPIKSLGIALVLLGVWLVIR